MPSWEPASPKLDYCPGLLLSSPYHLAGCFQIWNVHSVLNVLYSLVEKSRINYQVSVNCPAQFPTQGEGTDDDEALTVTVQVSEKKSPKQMARML